MISASGLHRLNQTDLQTVEVVMTVASPHGAVMNVDLDPVPALGHTYHRVVLLVNDVEYSGCAHHGSRDGAASEREELLAHVGFNTEVAA